MSNHKLKILNVNMSLDPARGGTVERTYQMSRFLSRAGVDCIILTTDAGITQERLETLSDLKVIVLPCILKRFYVPKFPYVKIKKLIENVDIIHLMGHWLLLNVLIYIIARKLKKPYVICPAGELSIYGRSKYLKRFFNLVIGKKIVANATGFIAITDNEIPDFEAYGINRDRISVIPNGVNQNDFLPSDGTVFRRKYQIEDHPFILFIGRLNHIKGPDLLLRAFCTINEQIPDHHLVFAGPDGGMLGYLRQIVAESKLEERVHFTGFLSGEDKCQAYYASNLLVIPSRQEAMSIVVLEAGCTGTPVLITNQCGFDEIESIGGGFVVAASVEGLQMGIEKMLENNDQLEIMGYRLKDFVSRHFLWSSVVNKYIALYNQILESNHCL